MTTKQQNDDEGIESSECSFSFAFKGEAQRGGQGLWRQQRQQQRSSRCPWQAQEGRL